LSTGYYGILWRGNGVDTVTLEINKIHHGDCLQLMKDIPDKSIDLIVTDPPYLMNYQSNYRKVKYKHIENDKDSKWLISASMKEFYRILKDDTAIYVFCSWHHIDFFKSEFENYFKLKNIIVWNKNNTSMGDLKGSFAPKHEFILFGHKGRRVLEGFRHPDVLNAKRTGNKLHPTEKPIDLIETFIKTSSKKDEVVLDSFIGSGTTAIAALNTSRFFIGIEKEKEYVDIANKRIQEAVSECEINRETETLC
jgi:site-specific DNA-methyltransferase (adenine-specific)